MRSLHLLATAAIALATSSSFAANRINASASAGFQSAQLTNSEVFTGECAYPPPSYLPVCAAAPQQSAGATSVFNFNGQTAAAASQVTGPGQLQVSASVDSEAPPFDMLRASSTASFEDELTFDVAGLSGQSVLVFMRYAITGTGTVTQDTNPTETYGSASLSFALANNYAYSSAFAGPGYTGGFFSPDYQYSGFRVFSAVVGATQSLRLDLSASCQGMSTVGGFDCTSTASFNYLGIAGLALPDGTEITDFSVTSISGYDYVNASAPIPEPATALMLLMGISALGLAGRRRQQA